MNQRESRRSRVLPWTMTLFVMALVGVPVADIWLDINYKLYADVSLLAAAVLVNVFTLLYWSRSAWKSNSIGRIYLFMCFGLSIFLNQAAVATWWDEDYPFRQQIRFAIYLGMALAYIPMIISLVREQHRDRHPEPDENVPVA